MNEKEQLRTLGWGKQDRWDRHYGTGSQMSETCESNRRKESNTLDTRISSRVIWYIQDIESEVTGFCVYCNNKRHTQLVSCRMIM